MGAGQQYTQVDEYIEELYGDEDRVLAAVEASLAESGMPQISVSPAHGRLLHVLVRLCGAKRVLELGTLAAYSTIWMARALPNGGRLITIESDPKHVAVASRNIENAGLESLVEIRHGRALEVLHQLIAEGEGPFDLIFIDADKPPLAEYFDWALQLSRQGTLIITDNVVRQGEVLDPNPDETVQGVQRFNAAMASNRSVISTILQTVGRKGHDGIALAVVL